MTFELVISESCNLKCKYCFEGEKENNKMNISMIEDIHLFIDKYLNNNFIHNKNNIRIDFNGGEALLNKEFIYEFIQKSKSKHFSFSITTNGTLIDNEIINLINEYNISLQISLDGDNKTHDLNRVFKNGRGSHELVLVKLKELQKKCNNLHLTISLVFTPDTVVNLAESIAFILENQFYNIVASYCSDDLWTIKDYEEYEKQLKIIGKLYIEYFAKNIPINISLLSNNIENVFKSFSKPDCGACKDVIAILPNGDVLPCGGYVGCFNEGSIKIGSLYDTIDFNKVIFYLEHKGIFDSTCSECDFLQRCHNKCFAVNNRINKNKAEMIASVCYINKISIKESDEVLNELLITKNDCFLKTYNKYLSKLYEL